MPGKQDLALPGDVVYVYDGGLAGFFSCVHASVYAHELPFDIVADFDLEPSLMETRVVETDTDKAQRVYHSIGHKISDDAQILIEDVFLSALPQRELAMLRFLLLGYREGRRVMDMLGHPLVAPLKGAQRNLYGEVHLLKGFVRFSDHDGKLVAMITPKNFVLPYLLSHFVERLPNEEFMIVDKTHHAALVYQDRKAQIIPVDSVEEGPVTEREAFYRGLWKRFYNTIAIEERYNPKCRMSHIPKRYWENMVEMKDLL